MNRAYKSYDKDTWRVDSMPKNISLTFVSGGDDVT